MPSTLTYPGVYIEELPSGVRTIIGVPTSVTAFIGRAKRGPTDEARTINSFGDFERLFGGLWEESRLGFSVRDFFTNGGGQAVVVRLFNAKGLAADPDVFQATVDKHEAAASMSTIGEGAGDAQAFKAAIAGFQPAAGASDAAKEAIQSIQDAVAGGPDDPDQLKTLLSAEIAKFPEAMRASAALSVGDLKLTAKYPGKWGANLRAQIDRDVLKGIGERLGVDDKDVFNLTVRDVSPGGASEKFTNLTFKPSQRQIASVLKDGSSLVAVDGETDALASPVDPAMEPGATAGESKLDEARKVLVAALTANAGVDGALDGIRTLLTPVLDEVSIEEQLAAVLDAAIAEVRQAGPVTDPQKTAFQDALDTVGASLGTARNDAADAISDGEALEFSSFLPNGGFDQKKGLFALRQADIFNLLVIPPYDVDDNVEREVIAEAAKFCEDRRAMLLIDSPAAWKDKDSAKKGISDATDDKVGTRSKNAAIFFPRIKQANPLKEMRVEVFPAAGVVAGVMARIDRERGVWKAPAGLDATLAGVPQLEVNLTDAENGELNPLGLNCLRAMPGAGRVVWGSRTREGDDRLASEWKYVPIRRLALFIEESLYRGTQWVVFEPNDEPLWASIRLNVGAFMNGLFRKGAFQGRTAREAYFVQCDKDTNPQSDVDQGIVNIRVGFAPLKPAEFVVIKFQQIAGQLAV